LTASFHRALFLHGRAAEHLTEILKEVKMTKVYSEYKVWLTNGQQVICQATSHEEAERIALNQFKDAKVIMIMMFG